MNALLDYGTSSSSGDDDSDTEFDERNVTEDEKLKFPQQYEKLKLPQHCNKLPTPSLENNIKTSVFSNPFVREEMAKAAILEKHVKMVPGKHDVQTINGRKICFAYRRGKCRFGHRCRFAHDSDVQKTQEEIEADKQKFNTVICENAGTMPLLPTPQFNVICTTDDSVWEEQAVKKRKRPGLCQGLIPGRKVLRMYHAQKLNDSLFKNKK